MPINLKNWREFIPHWSICLWLAACGLLVLLPAQEFLRYDRDAVQTGEFWRFFTANMVHSNAIHFALNAASVAVQSLLFRDLLPWRVWLSVSVWCALANVVGMHFFTPTYNSYVGMSGALYGVAIVGGLSLLLNREWLVGGVLSAYLNGRIIYEQNFTMTDELAQLIEAPVAFDAHLWGLLSGYVAMIAVALWWHKKR